MNILLIGNGFDLAHELPTKYKDFLRFVEVIREIVTFNKDCNSIRWDDVNLKIRKLVEEKRDDIYSKKDDWNNLIDDNLWIDYFLENPEDEKTNWIDFEKEISEIIKSLEKDMGKKKVNEYIEELSNKFFNQKIQKMKEFQNYSFMEWKNLLLSDLNKLIRAFEIYLADFVEQIKIEKLSPDIIDIVADTKLNEITSKKIEFCNVLNFNYTSTYLAEYLNRYKTKSQYENFNKYIDYIHGKAKSNNKIESNNMVLGIDEYLPKKRKNKDLTFISFKKFYQRIYKKTGCKYKDWINQIKKEENEINEEIHRLKKELEINKGKGDAGYHAKKQLDKLKNTPKHNLYIFGHSLDITDKDILKELILCNNVVTTIFYPDDEELGKKITNLVKIIGQKELIRKSGGDVATIKFVQQQEMKKKEEIEKDNT